MGRRGATFDTSFCTAHCWRELLVQEDSVMEAWTYALEGDISDKIEHQ